MAGCGIAAFRGRAVARWICARFWLARRMNWAWKTFPHHNGAPAMTGPGSTVIERPGTRRTDGGVSGDASLKRSTGGQADGPVGGRREATGQDAASHPSPVACRPSARLTNPCLLPILSPLYGDLQPGLVMMWGSSPTFFLVCADGCRLAARGCPTPRRRPGVRARSNSGRPARRSAPPSRSGSTAPDSRPGHGVTADDCARVSRALEAWFEGEGGVGARYLLQVSSPGLERPVRFPEHWRRYVGRAVRVTARRLAGHPRAVIVEVPTRSMSDCGSRTVRRRVVAFDDVKDALLQDADDTAAPGRREP